MGVALESVLKECVTNVKRVNDRIMVVKVVRESLILNFISTYIPQLGCEAAVKEKYCLDLDTG